MTMQLDASLPKKPPQVDLDRTRERLIRLGLVHAADRLGEHVATAAKETHPPHRFLDALLEAELSARDERRVRTSLKLSGLPSGHTLSNFDFAFQPSVERSRIETLATCAWIREKESLLIQGPPGVGKTHLAVALGVRAIENGFSVAFHRLEDLLAALKRDADVSPQRLRQRKHIIPLPSEVEPPLSPWHSCARGTETDGGRGRFREHPAMDREAEDRLGPPADPRGDLGSGGGEEAWLDRGRGRGLAG
jgi:hypothetical protein